MGDKRTQEQIERQLNTAAHFFDIGTKYPGMSYDEGVRDALTWALGDDDEPPYDDEACKEADE